MPNEADWKNWDNSPIYAPDEAFAKAPDAWIGVAERDILRDEGLAYGEKLKTFGKNVEAKIYKGAPHPIMAQDGEFHLLHAGVLWLLTGRFFRVSSQKLCSMSLYLTMFPQCT